MQGESAGPWFYSFPDPLMVLMGLRLLGRAQGLFAAQGNGNLGENKGKQPGSVFTVSVQQWGQCSSSVLFVMTLLATLDAASAVKQACPFIRSTQGQDRHTVQQKTASLSGEC